MASLSAAVVLERLAASVTARRLTSSSCLANSALRLSLETSMDCSSAIWPSSLRLSLGSVGRFLGCGDCDLALGVGGCQTPAGDRGE